MFFSPPVLLSQSPPVLLSPSRLLSCSAAVSSWFSVVLLRCLALVLASAVFVRFWFAGCALGRSPEEKMNERLRNYEAELKRKKQERLDEFDESS
ncbi:hypothetical protein Ahy_A03g014325 [Arachis hypogaea]|uniref:Transmembrane protein n=1 Tax=Arachis hypogaea TaxID=3818 RepID=A0A445DXS0_ARAHY|nr:hypothetical protein Ahy_A03g014325 [Arachis hypogaea]